MRGCVRAIYKLELAEAITFACKTRYQERQNSVNTNKPDHELLTEQSTWPTEDHSENRTPMTEEQILSVSVIPPAPLVSRIHLEEYNPDWPHLFER